MASDIKKKHLVKEGNLFPPFLTHKKREKKDRKGERKGEGAKRRRKEKRKNRKKRERTTLNLISFVLFLSFI